MIMHYIIVCTLIKLKMIMLYSIDLGYPELAKLLIENGANIH